MSPSGCAPTVLNTLAWEGAKERIQTFLASTDGRFRMVHSNAASNTFKFLRMNPTSQIFHAPKSTAPRSITDDRHLSVVVGTGAGTHVAEQITEKLAGKGLDVSRVALMWPRDHFVRKR